MTINNRSRLLLRAGAVTSFIVATKLIVHFAGAEVISINPLFSGIVAANMFLLGFLLSGVLTDYKESERLPGELSACLENITQEVRGIGLAHPAAVVGPGLAHIAQLSRLMLDWFHKRGRTEDLLDHLNELTPHIATMEQWTQATLVARLKQEQGAIRRIIFRIHTIRETSFVTTGYLLADMVTTLLCVGLVLARIEPFHESMFFVIVISYIMVFLRLLIRDLDNPFGYYERHSGEDVSLKPMEETVRRLLAISTAEHDRRSGAKA